MNWRVSLVAQGNELAAAVDSALARQEVPDDVRAAIAALTSSSVAAGGLSSSYRTRGMGDERGKLVFQIDQI